MKYLCSLFYLQLFIKIVAGNFISLPTGTDIIARKRIKTNIELPDRASRNELLRKTKGLNSQLNFGNWGTVPYYYFTYAKRYTAFYVKIDEQPLDSRSDVFEFVGGNIECVKSKVSEIVAMRIQYMRMKMHRG
ncbi:hypothetical protein A3F66_01905 [candidate division TM6 bacterium RIFCSPHIGHO2_12_FULL_32_22]|nr:MAG: hypothetical protein A3F66_01905 [candidate division TM6 bacterium RIFCSPHIGHO2_12_FULL_32_22]